ncbi:hypothetical protein GOEFS_018_00910 [Gordonia effusa NBRC 100432]|uniref:DUF418 domain-containing protein n=1 Tax=Gordonia effusa NBRC 100432 TaxID=1077974 RepID=H0QW58_9ACTN|nr:DUF418 domain-containing protein [Gordonia effusa]GAB17059.1 hypothetical protein GOEFS_018_00910 [Gordonia effusa NBRC 100432]
MAPTTSTDTSAVAAAPRSRARYASLDVLRGIAILGTLGTNIWIFTNAEGLVGYLNGTGHAIGSWGIAEDILKQLVQGKFLGLLTLMFGIGLAIQQISAHRRGGRWPGRYPWRAGLLFLDGLLNYFFFAEFDVLMGYAITGLVVAYLLSWRIRRQRVAAVIAVGVHVVLLTLAAVGLWLLERTATTSDPKPLSPNPYADGGFLDLVAFRAQNFVMFRFEMVFILPMSVALFLVGAALYRRGILTPDAASLRRKLMYLGFGVALPLDFIVGLFGGDAGLVLGRYGFAPIVSLGILAAVAHFYADARTPGAIGQALAPVGRMALSCYVAQNILAGAICYGWGLGLSAHLGPDIVVPATIGVFITISVAMMVFARLWMRRFDRGPLEWLWHESYLTLSRSR